MNHDLVIFDLDGTLVDSLPDIATALNQGLAGLGRPPVSLTDVRTLVGEGVLRLAERALALRPPPAGPADPPGQAQALADGVKAVYRARPCVESRLYPGIPSLLHELRANSARRLAVLTNKPGEVTRPLLAALGIASSLDAAIGDGDGYPRKPDPAAAQALMARFGVAPARTLVVGDGIPDLRLARAAGCPSAAALWGYGTREDLAAEGPVHLLEKPEDLLPIA